LKNRLVAVTDDDVNYYKKLYIPTHLNIGNYFIGVALGLILFDFKKTGRTLQKTFVSSKHQSAIYALIIFFCSLQVLRFLWYSCLVLGVLNLMSGYIFYNYDLEKPSIWVSILAVFLKHSWGLFMAFMMFGLIFRFGWFIPNIFNHPGWRITGRISFAGYIFHNVVVQLLIMDIYQPIYMDTVKFVRFLSCNKT
jgi:hypothetical protein